MRILEKFAKNVHGTALGAGGFLGLGLSCMSMTLAVERAFHRVWNAPILRPLYQRIIAYWVLLALGPLAFAWVLRAVTSKNLPISHFIPDEVSLFFLSAAGLSFAYKWVPSHVVRWKPALISGTAAAATWVLAKNAYGLYTHRALSYNKIYGSLAVAPLLLIWIYIAWAVVLTGAALSAAIQRRNDP